MPGLGLESCDSLLGLSFDLLVVGTELLDVARSDFMVDHAPVATVLEESVVEAFALVLRPAAFVVSVVVFLFGLICRLGD